MGFKKIKGFVVKSPSSLCRAVKQRTENTFWRSTPEAHKLRDFPKRPFYANCAGESAFGGPM